MMEYVAEWELFDRICNAGRLNEDEFLPPSSESIPEPTPLQKTPRQKVVVESPKKVIAAAELPESAAVYTELLPSLAAASSKKVDSFVEPLPPIIKGIIIKSYNIDACN
nr:hypothetical protein [Tanacetum cinerariifolium]